MAKGPARRRRGHNLMPARGARKARNRAFGTPGPLPAATPILIGIGANLPGRHGSPRQSCEAGLEALEGACVHVVARSRWWLSAPLPASADPWYVNGVAAVATELGPLDLLVLLHRLEADFGRTRRPGATARPLDLDLLAYGNRVSGPDAEVVLPHPRLHLRAFVLMPLAEVAPGWCHPVLGRDVATLIAMLPPGQSLAPLDEEASVGRGPVG